MTQTTKVKIGALERTVDVVAPVSLPPLDTPLSAVIAASGSLSPAIDLDHGILARIVMPAAWTTAVLTFDVSYDGTTFTALYDETGAEVTVQAAASRAIRLTPADWIGIRRLKVRSGTSGAAVNQVAERTLQLVLLPR